jgi:hypothetical protein
VKYAWRNAKYNFHDLKIKSAPLKFLEYTKDRFATLTECRQTDRQAGRQRERERDGPPTLMKKYRPSRKEM